MSTASENIKKRSKNVGKVTVTTGQYGGGVNLSGTTTSVSSSKAGVSTGGSATQQTGNTSQDYQAALFEKQGKTVTRTESGNLEIKDTPTASTKTTITKSGYIVKTPTSAIVSDSGTYAFSQDYNRKIAQDQRAASKPTQTVIQDKTPKIEETGFEKRVEALNKRDSAFYGSIGFKRIDKLSNWITGGGGYDNFENRSYWGKQAQTFTTGLLSWPLTMGGAVISAGSKGAAVIEGLSRKDTRAATVKEAFPVYQGAGKGLTMGRAAKEASLVYTQPSTYATAATFAFFPAAGKYIKSKATVTQVNNINYKGAKTTNQAQNIARISDGTKSTTTAQIAYNVKVGKSTYQVYGKGKQVATIKGSNEYSTGAFKFTAKGTSAKMGQLTQTVKTVGADSTYSYTTYSTFLTKGKGNLVKVGYGDRATKTQTVLSVNGLNTKYSLSVGRSGPTKTISSYTYSNKGINFKSVKLTTNTVQTGIYKENIIINDYWGQGTQLTRATAKTTGATGKTITKNIFKQPDININYPKSTNINTGGVGTTTTGAVSSYGTGNIANIMSIGAKSMGVSLWNAKTGNIGALSTIGATGTVRQTAKQTTTGVSLTSSKSTNKPVMATSLNLRSTTAIKTGLDSRTEITTKSALNIDTKLDQTFKQEQRQRQELINTPINTPALKQTPILQTPGIYKTPPNGPPPPIFGGGFLLGGGGGSSNSKFGLKSFQSKSFNPSARSAFLGIKGKTPQINITSGFGERFIPRNKKIMGFRL